MFCVPIPYGVGGHVEFSANQIRIATGSESQINKYGKLNVWCKFSVTLTFYFDVEVLGIHFAWFWWWLLIFGADQIKIEIGPLFQN